MFTLVLQKAEELEIKLPTFTESSKKQESSIIHTHTTPHVSLNQSPVVGGLCHFHVLAIVNSAAVCMRVEGHGLVAINW